MTGKAHAVVPFEGKHLCGIELNWTNNELIGDPMSREVFVAANEGGPCWTLFVEGEVVACYGIMIRWHGVASCWTLPNTPIVKKYPILFHKSVKHALKCCIEGFELHRVDTTVNEHFSESRNWMKRLGFFEEGYFRKYGPKEENMYQYTWLRE